jgi:hypothetical protein
MAKYRDVRDSLLYEYAKLIADAAVTGRPDRSPVDRRGARYWSFVNSTFQKLIAGEVSPSTILRENKLLVAAGRECAYCGSDQNLQWEHIVPRSRGGPDTIDNLVLSCATCNNQKGTLNPIEWYEKKGLNRSHVPRLVMGKLLKLVLDEHGRRGTLNCTDFPRGQGLGTSRSCLVFDLHEDVR